MLLYVQRDVWEDYCVGKIECDTEKLVGMACGGMVVGCQGTHAQGTHAQCHKASVNLTSAKMVFLEECSTSMPSSSVSGVPLHGHTSISQAKACQQPSQWHALGLSATWSVGMPWLVSCPLDSPTGTLVGARWTAPCPL